MRQYLEKVLRQKVIITEDKTLYKKLPLVYQGKYTIFRVETNGILWIAMHPTQMAGLVQLRKDRIKIERLANLNCALFLDNATFYIKEKLMDEGIPFIIQEKQVYLPFLSYVPAVPYRKDIFSQPI